MFKESLCFIIPTIGNYQNILRLLNSIKNQSVLPQQIIIVDAGENSLNNKLDDFNLNINYIKIDSPSLTKQRNIGIKAVKSDITLIGFLDDDIVLEKDCVKEILSFWENENKEIGGIGLNIINAEPPKIIFIKRFFLIETGDKGKVLPSGFNCANHPINNNLVTRWLCGGATVWRREVLDKYKFDEWFKGYGFPEDLDFSYRVGKEYKLVVVYSAKVRHLVDKLCCKLSDFYSWGRMQVKGRTYFVKKNPEFSIVLCLWANFGKFLINLFKGIFYFDGKVIKEALGIFLGIMEVLINQIW